MNHEHIEPAAKAFRGPFLDAQTSISQTRKAADQPEVLTLLETCTDKLEAFTAGVLVAQIAAGDTLVLDFDSKAGQTPLRGQEPPPQVTPGPPKPKAKPPAAKKKTVAKDGKKKTAAKKGK